MSVYDEPDGNRVIHLTLREFQEITSEAKQIGKAVGFEVGWREHYTQMELQKNDRNRPITKTNPFKETK